MMKISNPIDHCALFHAILAAWLAPAPASAAGSESVAVHNFVRADSDHMFRSNMNSFNATVGELVHARKPTTPDNQPVIRMNQDTLLTKEQATRPSP